MSFDFLIAPITWVNFLPAIVYLAVVTVLIIRKTVWHPVHAIWFVIGVATQAAVYGPKALLSVAAAALVFAVFVWSLSRTISATGILSCCVTLAILPLPAWYALGFGLLAALAVSLARTSLSRSRLIGVSALMSMGVTPAGLAVPNLDYLPQRSDQSNGRTTMLPPYLLLGLLLGAALEWLLASR